MVKKRVYVVLLLLLLVFFIVMFSLFGTKNIKQEKDTAVIIVGNSSVFKYQKKKWYNITYKSSLQDLSWKKYNVYSNNKKVGNYSLWYNDEWYVFDSNKNPINIDGEMLAYSANYDFKIADFTMDNVDDLDYVNYVLKDNNLSLSSQFSSIYKVSIDFDGDSVDEDFYLISNVFAMDFVPEQNFSIAFMVKDNTVYYIYKDISKNKNLKGCKPFYSSFFDADDDGKYEFIISCNSYSVSERIDMLYHFTDNEFKILISNK